MEQQTIATEDAAGIDLRGTPAPLHGGPLALFRFMRAHGMVNRKYARLMLALFRRRFLTPYGRRLRTDGLAFIAPDVSLEIGRNGRIELGRWSWLGHGTKIRCHEGLVSIGAKTVMGQECTISAYQHVSIGRECVIADRVMLIDFDHGMVEVDRPIRLQGIYKRDVRVGNNVWIGYGACILRGVTVGDNAVIGTNAVVTARRAGERGGRRRPGARHPHARRATGRCGGSEPTRTRHPRARPLGAPATWSAAGATRRSTPGPTPRPRPTRRSPSSASAARPPTTGWQPASRATAPPDGRLELELEPVRWSLRLGGDAVDSLSALCVVRDSEGRWLAGRRAAWVATWAGRWALGAGGTVEVGREPRRDPRARAGRGVVGDGRAAQRRAPDPDPVRPRALRRPRPRSLPGPR